MPERPGVAITRPAEDVAPLARALAARGLRPVATPLLQCVYRELGPLAAALHASARGTWIACTSRHGVEALAMVLRQGGLGPAALAHCRFAAVGPSTARALAAHGWTDALVPAVADAAHLAQALCAAAPPSRLVFPRAAAAREALPAILAAAGWEVVAPACYETVAAPAGGARLLRAIQAREVRAVTLASGTAAQAFAHDVPGPWRAAVALASIGPTTTAVARDAGLAVACEAAEPSLDALADAALHSLEISPWQAPRSP